MKKYKCRHTHRRRHIHPSDIVIFQDVSTHQLYHELISTIVCYRKHPELIRQINFEGRFSIFVLKNHSIDIDRLDPIPYDGPTKQYRIIEILSNFDRDYYGVIWKRSFFSRRLWKVLL